MSAGPGQYQLQPPVPTGLSQPSRNGPMHSQQPSRNDPMQYQHHQQQQPSRNGQMQQPQQQQQPPRNDPMYQQQQQQQQAPFGSAPKFKLKFKAPFASAAARDLAFPPSGQRPRSASMATLSCPGPSQHSRQLARAAPPKQAQLGYPLGHLDTGLDSSFLLDELMSDPYFASQQHFPHEQHGHMQQGHQKQGHAQHPHQRHPPQQQVSKV